MCVYLYINVRFVVVVVVVVNDSLHSSRLNFLHSLCSYQNAIHVPLKKMFILTLIFVQINEVPHQGDYFMKFKMMHLAVNINWI